MPSYGTITNMASSSRALRVTCQPTRILPSQRSWRPFPIHKVSSSPGHIRDCANSFLDATSSALNKIESWLYFDPRSANARGTIPPASQSRNQGTVSRGIEASFGQRRQGYTEALVFPVGGGSMDEVSTQLQMHLRHVLTSP